MKVTNNVKGIKHNLPSDAENSLILKTDVEIIVLRAAKQMEFSQFHILPILFLGGPMVREFLNLFLRTDTNTLSLLSGVLFHNIFKNSKQFSCLFLSNLITVSSACRWSKAVDGYDLLRAASWQWSSRSGKSLCGRMDGSHLSTAKDMLKVQVGAQFDSVCFLLEWKPIF